jgi:Reverse transcriptase (RNA-dependent DNA polymerase)
MSMWQALRQMPVQTGRGGVARGEAARVPVSDEACCPRHESGNTGSVLLEAVLTRENLKQALKRVRANKGAAGVDGLDIDQTSRHLVSAWPAIREQLLKGTYRPSPVRRVTIPKPDGGERELGIPTVTDRLIQQALLQVLQPILDPTFSEHSYGFRPGRRAHDAVLAAQSYVQSGRRVVVDVDLEKFFDRVNHDILIDRLQKRIGDAAVIRLIRAYLNSGIMDDGVVQQRHQGTPQGGPLTPWTQKITLSLGGRFRCAGPIQSLICVTRSNIKMSYVALDSLRKGSAFECRLSSACRWSQPQRGRRSHGRAAQDFAAPGLPLPARGAAHVVSGSRGRAHHSHHAQGSCGRCCHIAGVCAGQ